jgi:hypothetical protein
MLRENLVHCNKYGGVIGMEFQCIPEEINTHDDSNYNPILFEEEYANNVKDESK